MKKALLLLFVLLPLAGIAQPLNINNYKYVIVPEKFDFLKEPNQYNLNALTKMLFEKYGFEVYYTDDSLPPELNENKCRALYGSLEDHSGWFGTGLEVVLKDCGGKKIYGSEVGKSKNKDFKKGYYEAMRNAAASLDSLNYHYEPLEAAPAAPAPKPGPAVVANRAEEADAPATATAPAAVPNPVASKDMLFAQPIENGYQLVDTTPKVVLKMYRTSQPDSYTAMGDGKNGVVFKKGNDWFFEYYQNDKLVSEKLNIKF